MIRKRIALLVSTALFATAPGGHAQESPPTTLDRQETTSPRPFGLRAASFDPALDALVAEALRNNADVAGASASVDAAEQRISPARALPDPSLLLNYQNDGKSLSLGEREMTFLGAMFAQPLPWPGKLHLAGEEARSRAEEVKEGTLGRARLAVEARVRRAYYDYLLAKAQLDLIEDRSRSWRGIADVARERYAVGQGVQQDVLRAQTEILRLDESRAEQGAQVASRRTEINRVLGRAQDSEIETPARLVLRLDSPELSALLPEVRDRSPELAGIGKAIEAARLRASLARKSLFPDFVASGGPMYRGGLDPMWQVGLGVSLPIYSGSRQRPLLAAARDDLRAEEARAASARQELEFRTRERYESLTASLRIARLYDEGVLPVDRLSLESAIASYRAGKVPFVTVLEALNTLYADRSVFLARVAESEKWRVAIDEADLQATPGMTAAAPPGASAARSTGSMTSAPAMR